MNERQLQEIMQRLWKESDTVLGDEMVSYYVIEGVIREICGLWKSEDEVMPDA